MDFLAFSGLVALFLSLLSIYQLTRQPYAHTYQKLWVAFSAALAGWGLFFFLGFTAVNDDFRLFYFRCVNWVATWIPIIFFHFVLELTESTKKYRLALPLGYGITAFYFLVCFIFSAAFIPSISLFQPGLYYPDAGPLYLGELLLFIFFVNLAFVLAAMTLKNASHRKKAQLKILIVSTAIGFSGGCTTFFMVFDIPVYPLGAVGPAIMGVINAYAMVRYRLFDTSTILSLTTGRILSYSIILLGYFLLTRSDQFAIYVYLLICCEGFYRLKLVIERSSKNLLRKDGVNPETFLLKLKKGLTQIDSLNDVLATLEEALLDTPYRVKSLALIDIQLTPDQQARVLSLGINPALSDKSFYELMRHNTRVCYVDDLSNAEAAQPFNIQPADIYIPFINNQQVNGFVLLSSNTDRDASYDMMSLFDWISIHLGNALELINQRSRLISAASAEKENIISLLKSLAGSIAHELKTPLGMMMTNAELGSKLVVSNDADYPQKVRSRFDRIYQVGRSALQVVNLILNNMKNQEIDASQFAQFSALKLMNRSVQEYSCEYKFDQPIKDKIHVVQKNDFDFLGSETLFVFVIFNLLKNAAYYMNTKPDNHIDIWLEQQTKQNAIYIKDYGPGVPETILPYLFESFITSGKKDGTGLGLPFCKRAMKSFGGDIDCQSELGQYTLFTLTFPKIH